MRDKKERERESDECLWLYAFEITRRERKREKKNSPAVLSTVIAGRSVPARRTKIKVPGEKSSPVSATYTKKKKKEKEEEGKK